MDTQNKELLADIERQINLQNAAIQEMDNDRSTVEESFDEFQRKRAPYYKRLDVLDRRKRMLIEPIFKPIPDYGDVMSLADFKGACKSVMFVDDDGIGFYVRGDKESDIAIRPSDFNKKNAIRPDFDTIVWYNR